MLAVLMLIALAALQQGISLLRSERHAETTAAASTSPATTAASHERTESTSSRLILQPAMRQLAERTATDGRLSAWNPQRNFGEPVATVSGAAPWSPPFWLLGLLPAGPFALHLLAFLCSALACVTTFRLLRALSLSRYSASIGAALYALGWFATVSHGRLNEFAAAALTPWMLESGWRCLFPRRRSKAALGLAISTALAVTTGGLTTAALAALLTFALVVFGQLLIDRADRVKALTTATVGLLGAALLSAPVWLDLLELAPHLRDTEVARGTVPLRAALLALFAPGVFQEAGGATGNLPAPLTELAAGRDALELAWYPGALSLFVGLLGLLRPKRNLLSLFWLGVLALGLFLLLPTPVQGMADSMLATLPSRPGAGLMLFHLAVAILVALGLEGFLDAPHSRTFAVPVAAAVSGCAAVFLIAAFAWPEPLLAPLLPSGHDLPARLASISQIRAQALIPAGGLLVFAVLFSSWRRIGVLRLKRAVAALLLAECALLACGSGSDSNSERRAEETAAAENAAANIDRQVPSVPADAGRTLVIARRATPPLHHLAPSAPGGFLGGHGDRLLERTARYLELLDPAMVRTASRSSVGPARNVDALSGPFAARAGIGAALSPEPLSSIHVTELPLVTAAGSTTSLPSEPVPAPGTLDALAAPPAPAPAPLTEMAPPETRSVAESPPPTGSALRTYVSVPTPPRSRLAWTIAPADDATEADLALRLGKVATLDAAVIERPPAGFEPVRPAMQTTLQELPATPDRIAFRVDMEDGRGYLVVADAWAPGWEATVDGEPAELLHADLAFRAVALREGEHHVEMIYRPASERLGPWLFALGVLLSIALAHRALFR